MEDRLHLHIRLRVDGVLSAIENRPEEGSKPPANPARRRTGRNQSDDFDELTGDDVLRYHSCVGTPSDFLPSRFGIAFTLKLLAWQMSKPLKRTQVRWKRLA